MPRQDPIIDIPPLLEGDGRTYFVKSGIFPTPTSLLLEVSSAIDDQFITKIGSGLAPFQNGVLTYLDYSLNPVLRYGWSNTTLTRVDFPAMDATLNSLVTFTITLGVVNVQPVTQDSSQASGSSGGGRATTPPSKPNLINFHLKATQDAKTIRLTHGPSGHRKDPYVNFLFRIAIDGIDDNLFYKRIDPFSVGQGASNTFVVTCTESNATPFRTWYQSGGKRAGKIEYLNGRLRPCFRMDFTGLSIPTIYPAFPGNIPANITFAFDSVIFYPVS